MRYNDKYIAVYKSSRRRERGHRKKKNKEGLILIAWVLDHYLHISDPLLLDEENSLASI